MPFNFEELEALFTKGYLSECLSKLKEYYKEHNNASLEQEVLLEMNRLEGLKKQYHSNLIDFKTYDQEMAKIRTLVLTFINKMKAPKDVPHTPKAKTPHTPKAKTPPTPEPSATPPNVLEGVWESTNGHLTIIWTLLPNNLVIINNLDRSSSLTSCEFRHWHYNSENKIISHIANNVEAKGTVEWLAPDQFKLTILDYLNTVLIFKRIFPA